MSTATRPAAPRPETEPLAFNVAAILIGAALAGLGFAYGIDAAVRASGQSARSAEAGALTRSIAGHDLAIPRSWFRFEESPGEGFSRQVELRIALPLEAAAPPVPVDVTLMPRSAARPSARLLDAVYLHMFEPADLSGPPGLIGKPLRTGEGYDGETVWYDPLSPEPFVAKCLAPVVEGARERCLRVVQLDTGIAAAYAFDASVLAHWRSFDAAMAAKLRFIGAL